MIYRSRCATFSTSAVAAWPWTARARPSQPRLKKQFFFFFFCGVVAHHVEGIKCISFRATAILILEIAACSWLVTSSIQSTEPRDFRHIFFVDMISFFAMARWTGEIPKVGRQLTLPSPFNAAYFYLFIYFPETISAGRSVLISIGCKSAKYWRARFFIDAVISRRSRASSPLPHK